jgi:dimethylargininase
MNQTPIGNHTAPNYTRAIVRPPGESLVNGITTAGLGTPDFALALKQHAAYVEALEALGLEVRLMEPAEGFPDSTFVEDTALLTTECAAGS